MPKKTRVSKSSRPVSKSQVRAREALRQLQSQSRLTPSQAEAYLQEVRAERLAYK
jgi:hypothetical protein